jgi:phosphate transport system permease protein
MSTERMSDRMTEPAAAAATSSGVSTSGAARLADGGRVPPHGAVPTAGRAVRYGDHVYSAILFMAALSIFIIIVVIAVDLCGASFLSIERFGFHYVTGKEWDETRNIYGILPFIFGTLYSSLIALFFAVPVSIGAAIFLAELAPRWVRTPVTFLIELLAAIPSVVYGLWGIFVLLPFLKTYVMQPISSSGIPAIPVIGGLFAGDPIGPSMLAAGVILAIMIIPFITAVARDILRAIPKSQREGSYGLGATWWETTSRVVLPFARSGIIGAVILGLGRALGETMAVTMVIGNQSPRTPSGVSWSLFDPGYTMSSALANKFNEASPGISTAALVEIGLVLFVVTVIVNAIARLLVRFTARDLQGRK